MKKKLDILGGKTSEKFCRAKEILDEKRMGLKRSTTWATGGLPSG